MLILRATLGLVWLSVVASTGAAAEERRSSLATLSVDESWRQPGFRLDVGYAFVPLVGLDGAPSFQLHGLRIRPGVRLSEDWSARLDFTYAMQPGAALTWAVVVEPAWHPIAGLSVSAGIGYAGLMELKDPAGGDQGVADDGSSGLYETPAFYDHDAHSIAADKNCSGDGFVMTLGAEYSWSLASIFALGPYAQAEARWSECTVAGERLNAETGQKVSLRQNWLHVGGRIGVWLSWR